jgi:N,N'-diacetyllegionaminate synthase
MKLVAAAKASGADAVKFQTFKAEKLVSRNASKAEYQLQTTSIKESQFEMIKNLELSEEDHRNLFRSCNNIGLQFLSSPFDEESVDFLDSLGVEIFKVPSGEITNIPYLKHIAKKKKKIILSTGMAKLGEIEEALETIREYNNKISLLHCVTEYPAPYNQINLNSMVTMALAFKLPVGYSDHTAGFEVSLAAVALGAKIIEKHFTIDKNLPGPDHKASLDPCEFGQMISSIRKIELALGDGIKKPAQCEINNINVARKSIVAVTELKKGEIFTKENIMVKRPGNGIPPKYLWKLLGKKASKNYQKDDLINIEDLYLS